MMRYFQFFVFAFILLFFSGCINEEDEPEWVLEADVFQYQMIVGETVPVNIFVHELYESYSMEYHSDDESIVVFEDGELAAIGVGDTVVTVTLQDYPEYFLKFTVSVIADEANVPQLVLSWVKEQIGTEITKPIFFPTTHPEYDVEIEYVSDNPEILTNEGIPYHDLYDVGVALHITVRYKDNMASEEHNVVVVGSAHNTIANSFFSQLPIHRRILTDYDINVENLHKDFPNAVVTWHSSNQSVFDNNGIYTKPLNDTKFFIYVNIYLPDTNSSHEFVEEFIAAGVSIHEKAEIVKAWFESENIIGDLVTSDLELPIIYHGEFEAVLEWTSNKPSVITADGKITPSSINELVTLNCLVTIGLESRTISFKTEIPAKDFDNKWNAIEGFLDAIFISEIRAHKFTVAGVAPSYTAYNYGYVPFYVNERSDVTVDILPDDHRVRPTPGTNFRRKYVVIHDTANNSSGAGASMHNDYIKNTDRQASWHYTVDDVLIFQHIPDQERAWHAGDNEGNTYGIGIETCINPEVNYTTVMQRTAKLTAELLEEYDLSIKDIRQHYDFTKKDCPRVMRSNSRWNEFLNLTAIEYAGIHHFSDVEFIWESLSKDIMDDTGRVHNHPGIQTNVSFKVTVTYNNETRTYNHTATLLPPQQ